MRPISQISLGVLATVSLGALACSPQEPPASPAGEPAASGAGTEATPDASDAAEVAECGPQSPRDISVAGGTNELPVPFGETPRLCNVHFHEPFEHAGFSDLPEATGPAGDPVCKSIENGDKVEFHWVYTNCPEPAEQVEGLANCVCDRDDVVLRVYAQTYVVDEDGGSLEQPSGDLVTYVGSTTGTSYDDEKCSPARVNWEVNATTLELGKKELGAWCADNEWIGEDYPHGSRAPVTKEAWLSPFAP